MSHFKNTLKTVILLMLSVLPFQDGKAQIFGKPSKEEISMTRYAPDPEASGVVLYERGNYKVEAVNNYLRLIKEIYVKIKVLNAKNFEHATIEIPYYRTKDSREKITEITAATFNGKIPTYVKKEAIFDTDETEHWSLKKFTFPNIQDGSILEYSYRVESPYFFNLGSWNFQGPLPVIHSEFHTEILGNWHYNRTLFGNRKLYTNKVELKKNCFHLRDYSAQGDCESATYIMKNAPALTKERYMLSEKNYIARIKYELISYTDFRGKKTSYTETWADADKVLKLDKNVGQQLKYDSYFKKQLPESILSLHNPLDKAKTIYYYYQERMNWNGKYGLFANSNVKNSFEQRKGNSSEINLGLVSALNAAGLDAKIMLIATRNQQIPTNNYPVLSDFNYAMVFLNINNEKHFLDATEKNTPFGVVPFKNLNMEGRVLDFNKGSYWEPIEPFPKNLHYINMALTANESGVFEGEINEVSTGYISVEKRKNYNDYGRDEAFKRKQAKNESWNISDYKVENEKNLEQPFKENYHIELHEQPVGNTLFLFPFMMETYFSENPFVKNSRNYPIHFGFPLENNYLISIDLAKQYTVVKLPQSKVIKLPGNDGELSVAYEEVDNKINIRLNVKLKEYFFPAEAYKALQQFFTSLIKIQNGEPIELRKI
ncbi:DUF3857 domain-containing protein [Aequorivita sp. H23M31]|uniref:DUF3857 domain-containing protein n=1 Tax=Aequorivita ciconiae TaxID=2494375 RepID=A0A410G6Q4_9FLAO|nr:transglutaminase domain-containing protein [Aequorivita sp. H23M31]QAA82978.1 DUF3857 domain-containing protein [Aequorivita sp. H23M31]